MELVGGSRLAGFRMAVDDGRWKETIGHPITTD